MVFVRYGLGAFQHYTSVAFTNGAPWRVADAKRELVEASYAASDVCTAVRLLDHDVARLLMLTKLRGGVGGGALGAAAAVL